MPRTKALPQLGGALHVVVDSLVKENAKLKAELAEVQADLSDTIERMLDEKHVEQALRDRLKKDLHDIYRAIGGPVSTEPDPQYYLGRIRIMKDQLRRMRDQVDRLESIVINAGLDVDGPKVQIAGKGGA